MVEPAWPAQSRLPPELALPKPLHGKRSAWRRSGSLVHVFSRLLLRPGLGGHLSPRGTSRAARSAEAVALTAPQRAFSVRLCPAHSEGWTCLGMKSSWLGTRTNRQVALS